MYTIIVMGLGTAGLAVIRGLKNIPDIKIIGMAHTKSEIGNYSRHLTEKVLMPHPGRDEDAFIRFLLDNAHKWPNALILESGDYMAIALSKNKDKLSPHYTIATPDWTILQKIIFKDELHKEAEACGVPVPKTFRPLTLEDAEGIKKQILYPCILKPTSSHEFVSRFKQKMFKVEDETLLIPLFKKCLDANLRVVIQEIVEGPEHNIQRLQTYVNSKGDIAPKVFSIKIRQNPPRFGVQRVGQLMARNKKVEELSELLIKETGYKGYCNFEFKKDERDEQLKLIEINVRMPRTGYMAISGGANFPLIIFQDLILNNQIKENNYKVGHYWIELIPD